MIERLATVLYAIFSLVASLIAGIVILIAIFSGDSDAIVPVILFCFSALVLYGVGWSARYVLTGNKDCLPLKILTRNKKNKLNIFTIANLPIFDLMNQTEPMNMAEKDSSLSDDENLNSIVYSGIIALQLFVYFELVKSRFGKDVSRATSERMYLTLDRFSEEDSPEVPLGQHTQSFVSIIEGIYQLKPVTTEVGGKTITFPKEYDVAAGLLYYSKTSPYYSSGKKAEDLPVIQDELDIKFTNLLELARAGIINKYAPIIFNENNILEESSAFGLRVEDKLAA